MTSYRHIAALGSSFAAGPGIQPVEDPAAMRSQRNYAHLLAKRLDAELVDLTVSGATIATVLREPQTTMSGVQYAPQIAGVPEAADLVTVTAGGNDLQFVGSMLFEAWARKDPTSPLISMMVAEFPNGIPAPTAAAINAMASGLMDIVTSIQARAPGARVILVDYLTVIGEKTRRSTAWPFDPVRTAEFRRIQDAIAEGYHIAGEHSGTEILRASGLSEHHGLGSADPWVFGFQPTMETTGWSFHPNEAGMRAIAAALEDHLTATSSQTWHETTG